MSGQQGSAVNAGNSDGIQLSITELTTPTDTIREDFDCNVKIKNTGKTAGRGTAILMKDDDGKWKAIESRETRWEAAGSDNSEVIMVFRVPITTFRKEIRKHELDVWNEGKHQLYLATGSGSQTDGNYAKQDGKTSSAFMIKKPPLIKATSLNLITAIAIGVLISAVIFTLFVEYEPRNTQVTVTSSKVSNGTLVVIEHPNVVVPIRNAVNHVSTKLYITVYTNNTDDEIISNVTLSTSPTSLMNLTSAALVSNYTIGKTEITRYQVNASIQHTGNIGNATSQSEAKIAIIDSDTGATREVSVPFQWNVNLLDFNQPMYFWFVLIGLIVSRYVSFSSGTTSELNTTERIKKAANLGQGKNPLLWIIFSGVLAVLVFAGFQDQVKLTNNVLFNLAAAFTFGFGFDKVLEKLKDVGRPSGT